MDRANIIKKNRNEWFDKAVKYKAENESLKVLLSDKRTISKEDAEFLAGVSSENIDLKVENDKLKEFARKVISWECWEYGDLDGGSVQDLAEKLGLIKSCIATKEDVGDPDFAYFDEGDTIYRFTKILLKRITNDR